MADRLLRNTPIERETGNEGNGPERRPGRGACLARAACRMDKMSKACYYLVAGSLLGAVWGANSME